jgi:hypothetical protein
MEEGRVEGLGTQQLLFHLHIVMAMNVAEHLSGAIACSCEDSEKDNELTISHSATWSLSKSKE